MSVLVGTAVAIARLAVLAVVALGCLGLMSTAVVAGESGAKLFILSSVVLAVSGYLLWPGLAALRPLSTALRSVWMDRYVITAAVLSCGAVASSYMAFGRYTATKANTGSAYYVLDRFTGDVRMCHVDGCETLKTK